MLRFCNARPTVRGNLPNSDAMVSLWPLRAVVTVSLVSKPASAILRSSPVVTPKPSANARAKRGLCSMIELNSSPRSTPPCSPCTNWVMAALDACAPAPLNWIAWLMVSVNARALAEASDVLCPASLPAWANRENRVPVSSRALFVRKATSRTPAQAVLNDSPSPVTSFKRACRLFTWSAVCARSVAMDLKPCNPAKPAKNPWSRPNCWLMDSTPSPIWR